MEIKKGLMMDSGLCPSLPVSHSFLFIIMISLVGYQLGKGTFADQLHATLWLPFCSFYFLMCNIQSKTHSIPPRQYHYCSLKLGRWQALSKHLQIWCSDRLSGQAKTSPTLGSSPFLELAFGAVAQAWCASESQGQLGNNSESGPCPTPTSPGSVPFISSAQ